MKSQRQDKSVEEEILRIENELFAAIRDKDTKRLDNILAEDFVYRNPMTGEQAKTEFLKAVNSLPLEIISVWSEDMKVNVYSEVAVMTGTQKAKVRNKDGSVETGSTAFTDIFVRRHGKWVLSLAHGVDLPSATAGK
jgi:ketosteroid isomerase-like protein